MKAGTGCAPSLEANDQDYPLHTQALNNSQNVFERLSQKSPGDSHCRKDHSRASSHSLKRNQNMDDYENWSNRDKKWVDTSRLMYANKSLLI